MSEHPLVARVRGALRRPSPADEAYLQLLARRLVHLARVADGATQVACVETPREQAAARRFVQAREASWHDGDENLVRGWLDVPPAAGERDEGPGLLRTADRLAAIEARPETLWCFLWELEARWKSLR